MAATLEKIAIKIRRLTKSLDDSSITDDQIYEYVDDFVLYDMPSRLKLKILNQQFSWVCNPNIGTYDLDDTALVNALVNFDQNYVLLDSPMYVAGQPLQFFQNESLFWSAWPRNRFQVQLGTGDGVKTQFTKTLDDRPIEQGTVLVSAIGTSNEKVAAQDVPVDTENGTWVDVETQVGLVGSINYLTGAIDVTLDSAPKAGSEVQIQYYPYVSGIPLSLLYYQNQFILRPIPDRPYDIRFAVQKRPSALATAPVNPNATPELEQWWQYIAYGAAIKVLQDRLDNITAEELRPEFMNQEELVLNRTVRQQGTERSFTIYAEQAESKVQMWGDNNWWRGY
jgi:hypothetical protein